MPLKLNIEKLSPHICFKDTELSWKAKGIAIYLMTSIDVQAVEDLIEVSKDGVTSLMSGIKELEEKGYLVEVSR